MHKFSFKATDKNEARNVSTTPALTLDAHHQFFNPFNAGTDFRRQNLPSKVDSCTERVKDLSWL